MIRTCLLLLLLSGGLFAADATLPDPTDLQRLQGMGAQLPPNPDEGDFLGALSATAAGATSGDTSWKAQDYDDLYALLQKYRDELRALGEKRADYEKQLADLQAQSDDISKRLDALQPLDGLKIHGDILTYYDDVNVLGPGASLDEGGHYRHAVQRAELQMTYTRGILHGLVEYDMQYIFGNQFDGPVYLGTQQTPVESGFSQGGRQMYVELLTPVQIRIGYFDYKQTPLTFWRNEDPNPFLPEPFSDRLVRLRQDLLLQDDNKNELVGIRLLSDPEFWSGNHLHFSAAVSQIANQPEQGDILTPGPNSIYSEPGGGTPITFLEVYNTFLGAWMLHYSTPHDWLDFGYQGTYMGDDDGTDSGTPGYSYTVSPDPTQIGKTLDTFYSYVNSGSVALSPTSWMGLDGEMAFSAFHAPAVAMFYDTPSLGEDGTQTDSAGFAHLNFEFGWMNLQAHYIDVGSGFMSAPAQARTWDPEQSPMGPFETENSLFDPASGGFDMLQAPRAPETIYNRTILPPAYWYVSGSNVISSSARMPYDPTVNSLDPYGEATPNREGEGASMTFRFFRDGLELGGIYDLASEIQGENGNSPQSFGRLTGGLRLNLMPLWKWPVRGVASYTLGTIDNNQWVGFDSVLIQGGLEWDLWKGGTLQAGYRHFDFNGVLPYMNPAPFAPADPTLSSYGREVYNSIYDQWALALIQDLGDDMIWSLNYGDLYFDNLLVGQVSDSTEARPNFELEQGYTRLTLRF